MLNTILLLVVITILMFQDKDTFITITKKGKQMCEKSLEWSDVFNTLTVQQKRAYFDAHGCDESPEIIESAGFILEDSIRAELYDDFCWPEAARLDRSSAIRIMYYAHHEWPVEAKNDPDASVVAAYHKHIDWVKSGRK